MVQLSDVQFTLVVLAGLLIVCIAGVVIYYISRKYPKKTTKLDPMFKAFYVWFLLLIGYVIIFLLGIRTQDDAKGDLKWLIIALVVLVLFYTIVSFYVNRTIPSYKLWKEYVLPDVKKFWNAEPYAGYGYISGMLMHKVIDVGSNKAVSAYLQDANIKTNKVEVFYGQAFFANMFPFLAVRDKYTGEDLMLVKPPVLTIALMQRFLGEQVVSSFQSALDLYDTEEHMPSQQYGVRNNNQQSGVTT